MSTKKTSKKPGLPSRKVTKHRGWKDPNQPKRPMTAFIFFAAHKRNEVKEKHPEATFGELGKLISAAWFELSAEEKQVYEAKALEDQRRYAREMASYVPAEPPSAFSKEPKAKAAASKRKPSAKAKSKKAEEEEEDEGGEEASGRTLWREKDTAYEGGSGGEEGEDDEEDEESGSD